MSQKDLERDSYKSTKKEDLEVKDSFIAKLKCSNSIDFKFPLVTESKPRFELNENQTEDNFDQVHFEKEGLWIAKIEKIRKGVQVNNELLIDFVWDDDAKEIKYQQKRDKTDYYVITL